MNPNDNAILMNIPTSYFIDTNKLILKFIWKGKKNPNSQQNIEGEEQSWRTDTTQIQDLLSSCSNQESMVLGKEQTNRSMEWNRHPRNRPT